MLVEQGETPFPAALAGQQMVGDLDRDRSPAGDLRGPGIQAEQGGQPDPDLHPRRRGGGPSR